LVPGDENATGSVALDFDVSIIVGRGGWKDFVHAAQGCIALVPNLRLSVVTEQISLA
jgi:hypothetical protein